MYKHCDECLFCDQILAGSQSLTMAGPEKGKHRFGLDSDKKFGR